MLSKTGGRSSYDAGDEPYPPKRRGSSALHFPLSFPPSPYTYCERMDRQESHTSSPGWLSQVTRKVELRWRLERGKSALASGIAILAVLEGVWAVLASFKRSWIAPFPYGAAAGCATLLLIALHAWLRRVDPKMLLRGIDRRLHLPDTVLSAGELAGQDAWVEHLRTESLAQTLSADWSRVWPTPWPKWSGYSSIGCVAFLALLTYFYSSEMTSRRALMSRPAMCLMRS